MKKAVQIFLILSAFLLTFIVTKQLNVMQYTGVCFSRGKWIARIKIKDKVNYIGNFNTEIDAHEAYQKALTKITEDETNTSHVIFSV